MIFYNNLIPRFDLRQYAQQLTLPQKFKNCSYLLNKVDQFDILMQMYYLYFEFKKSLFFYVKVIFIYGQF